MVNYTFTTDQGWRVTEYRPFSASYAVLHTPAYRRDDYTRRPESYAQPGPGVGGTDLLGTLTSQQLTFEAYSTDVLRQLLAERVTIRDRNRSAILGRLTELSGEIYGASLPYTPEGDKRRQGLEKTKLDLERELRETDERLWQDTTEIREKLVAAARHYAGTSLRSSLFSPAPLHDDQYQRQGFSGLSD